MKITTAAVYTNGVLRPQAPLDLPDNSLVQIEITPLQQEPESASTLFGAFPELRSIGAAELEAARRAWGGE